MLQPSGQGQDLPRMHMDWHSVVSMRHSMHCTYSSNMQYCEEGAVHTHSVISQDAGARDTV